MGAAIGSREGVDEAADTNLEEREPGPRALALAEIYDGASRSDAARIDGEGLQIFRDWVLRFNARGPDGLLDGKAPRQRSVMNNAHRRVPRYRGVSIVSALEHGAADNLLHRFCAPARTAAALAGGAL